MPVTIMRKYHCESAHFLPLVAEGHKCKRMHGHNYQFEVALLGPLDERGWILDFWSLDDIVMPIIAEIDHRVLNDIVGLENPTAEIIAAWLFLKIEKSLRMSRQNDALFVKSVCVWETPEACAIYCS